MSNAEVSIRYMRNTRTIRMEIGSGIFEMTPQDARLLIGQIQEAISDSVWDGVDWQYVDTGRRTAIHLAGARDNQTLCGRSFDKLGATGFRPLKSGCTLNEHGLCDICKRSYTKRTQVR